MTVEISQVAIWASIASPIIAVIIAVLSGVSSRKATAKQIAALEESTQKQVEIIKQLTYTQLKIAKIQLDKELALARRQKAIIEEEIDNANNVNNSVIGSYLNEFTKREAEKRLEQKNLFSKLENAEKIVGTLKGSLRNLTELKNEVDSHEYRGMEKYVGVNGLG
jgi:hypothetical protein